MTDYSWKGWGWLLSFSREVAFDFGLRDDGSSSGRREGVAAS